MAGIFLTSADDDEPAEPLVRSRWSFEDRCEAKIVARRIHIFAAVDLLLNFRRRCMGEAPVDDVDQSAVTRLEQVARIKDDDPVGSEQGPVPTATCHNLPFQQGSCDFAPEKRHEASRPSGSQGEAQARTRRKFQSDAECKLESGRVHQQSSPVLQRFLRYLRWQPARCEGLWSGSASNLFYKVNFTRRQERSRPLVS